MDGFFANMYELFGLFLLGPNSQFSQDMYQNGIYNPIAIWMFIMVALFVLLYYFVINHARMSKAGWWILWGIIVSLINFGIAWWIADDQLFYLYDSMQTEMPYGAMTEFFPFCCIVFFWSFVYYLLFSVIVKRFSVNGRHTPWKSVWPKH